MQVTIPFPGKPQVEVTIFAPASAAGAGYILALSQKINELLSLCVHGIPTEGELQFVVPKPEREPEKPGSIYARDITSSMIRDFEWHPYPDSVQIGGRPNYGDLYVTFNSGRQYRYATVERERVETWVEAPSKGEYFNKWIRGRYESTLVSDSA
jgi:hypothetical protein